MDKPLLALTLWQPMAWAIFDTRFPKDVENRDWPTKLRGTIAIHAAKNEPKNDFYAYKAFIKDTFPEIEFPSSYDRGAILGLVDIVDCMTSHSSRWFVGTYGFVLANPRKLESPIPCRGYQTFWQVPIHIKELIQHQLKIAA